MIMTKRSAARASQLIDNDQVRVTRFEFKPDDETGWHEHGFDYVIVALTDCTMLIEEGGGERTVDTWNHHCMRKDRSHDKVHER